MSADPKSLAVLAIASAKNKTKKSDSSQDEVPDLDHMSIRKFGWTDEFVAGCIAAFINTTTLFPINKLMFRQMAGGHGVQIAAVQMKKEGIRYLYRGILPPLMQKMVSVSIMFGSYGYYKKWADKNFTFSPPIANLAFAACLTGATEAVLTPLERVQMLLQDRSYHREYKNTRDALIKLRKFGFAEYYRGLTCVLIRNGPSNILFFGLRDEIKKFMPRWSSQDTLSSELSADSDQIAFHKQQQRPNPQLYASTTNYSADSIHNRSNPGHANGQSKVKDSTIHNFLSGAILGMFISTLFYPLSVVRTRMQTRKPGTEFLSIVKAFNAVYNERDRKFSRLFRGCLINVLRQFGSWGITNCSYEYVLDAIHDR